MQPWIGVDLDGTLAKHEPGADLYPIGPPIPATLRRVTDCIARGQKIKIMTARVGPQPNSDNESEYLKEAIDKIQDWCHKHIGYILEITCCKDFAMIELWDDRAIQVQRNTGKILKPRNIYGGDYYEWRE